MGINYWWIYDVIFILAAGFCIYSCAKKGFSDVIILILGCIVSVLLASVVSQNGAAAVYDSFVKQSSIRSVRLALEDYNPAVSVKEAIENQDYGVIIDDVHAKNILTGDDPVERMYEYTNQAGGYVVDTYDNFTRSMTRGFAERFAGQLGTKLPPYVLRELTAKIPGNKELFIETVVKILKSPGNVPEYIEENYIRQPAMKLVSAFIFVISYFIFMLIVRTVIYRSISLGLLNGYDTIDRIAGGLVGTVQAASLLIIIAVIVKIMIYIAESDGGFFSYDTVEKTKLFSYVFKLVKKY